MSAAVQRLAALAAGLAPRSAERLLAHVADDEGRAAAVAAALAGARREERLAALSAALREGEPPSDAGGRHPVLRRLEREARAAARREPGSDARSASRTAPGASPRASAERRPGAPRHAS